MKFEDLSPEQREKALACKSLDELIELAKQEGNVVFAGRLGGYKYYDMDKAIAAAFDLVESELGVRL